MIKSSINIASFPTPSKDTYYYWLYYDALKKYGYNLVDTRNCELTPNWIKSNPDIDIIHFHWPAYIYSKPSLLKFASGIANFYNCLREAKRNNVKIAWTAHNLLPHERNNIVLEYVARYVLAKHLDIVFVHFDAAKLMLKKYFPIPDCIKIPHGNFRQVFTNTLTKSEARQLLNVPEDKLVFLIFGPVRPYKGIEDAITAFLSENIPNAELIIAGNPSDSHIAKTINSFCYTNKNVRFFPKFIDKEEVQLYFNSADVVILPYKAIFTSGNLFLAMTFGKPVIAPDTGIISEVATEDFSIKYDASTPILSLQHSFKQILEMNLDEASRASSKAGILYSWDEAARISDEVFRNILKCK